MKTFPDLTACRALIFLSNLSNIDEVNLVANSGKTSLAKETARLIQCFFANCTILLSRNPAHAIILVN